MSGLNTSPRPDFCHFLSPGLRLFQHGVVRFYGVRVGYLAAYPCTFHLVSARPDPDLPHFLQHNRLASGCLIPPTFVLSNHSR